MTRKQLYAFRAKVKEARQLRDKLAEMETRIYNPKSQQLTSAPHSSGGRSSFFEDSVIAHLQLQDKYRELLASVEREQLELENAMTDLEPKERMLIRYRYIDDLNWETVCEKIGYSWTQTHRFHRRILKKLTESK